MKTIITTITAIIFLGIAASATEQGNSYTSLNLRSFSFIAPIVASESDVPTRAGLMFYDIGDGLKIVTPAGNIERITTEGLSGTVSSTGGGEIVTRARIELSSGTPVILSQSGDWIDSITDNGTGDFTINFVSPLFGSAPVCVCTVEAANSPRICQMNETTTISTVRFLLATETGAGVDIRANIICMSAK